MITWWQRRSATSCSINMLSLLLLHGGKKTISAQSAASMSSDDAASQSTSSPPAQDDKLTQLLQILVEQQNQHHQYIMQQQSQLSCSPAATYPTTVNPFLFCASSSISAAASVLFAQIATSFRQRRCGSMVPGDGTSSCWPQRVTSSACPGRHSVPQGESAECIYKPASQFIFTFLRNQESCVVSLLSRVAVFAPRISQLCYCLGDLFPKWLAHFVPAGNSPDLGSVTDEIIREQLFLHCLHLFNNTSRNSQKWMPLVLPNWQTRLCALNQPLLPNFYLFRRWTHIPGADTRILVIEHPRFPDAVVLPVVELPTHLVSTVAAIHTQEPYALPRRSGVTGVVNADTTGKFVAQVESMRWIMRAPIQLPSPQMNGRKTVWKQFRCLLGH